MNAVLICLDMDPVSIQGDVHTGAAHLYVKETLEMLHHFGVKTIAFTRWNSPSKPNTERIGEHVELYRLPIGDITHQPKEFLLNKEAEALSQIDEVLTQHDFIPDLVHGIYWYSGNVASQLAIRFRTPFIYTIISLGKVKHSFQKTISDHDRCREISEQNIFEHANIILSVCEQEKNNLLDLYPGINSKKIRVIGRGLDSALFTNNQTNFDEELVNNHKPLNPNRYLLFVGRLILSKGYPFLFKVYESLLADTNFSTPSLWIIGGTSVEIQNAKENISFSPRLTKADASGLIRWCGIIPRQQMPSFYRNAVCTCLPSVYDPAARVVLESMACGTPVIMSSTGYSNEVVITGENGYVANYDDTSAWINYIKALTLDPVWRNTLGARASDTIYPYFSMREFWKRQYSAYIHALDKQPNQIPNLNILRTSKLFPHWQVPYTYEDPGTTTQMKDIIDFCSVNLGIGHLEEKKYYELGSSSNFVLHWVTPRAAFLVKSFRNKKRFHRIFWPTEQGDLFRGSRECYTAETYFSQNDFFISPCAKEDRLLLAAYPIAKQIKSWTNVELETLIMRLTSLHSQTINFTELPCLDGDAILPLPSFQLYDQELMQLNSNFRGGGKWFSPAHLMVELKRTLAGFNNHTWGFIENQDCLIKSVNLIMANIDKQAKPLRLSWGECRPGHLFNYKGKLCGIDAESCAFAESERDYGEFLWWMFDLRTHDLEENDIKLAKVFLKNFDSPIEKWRILGWAWLVNFFFLLWDIRRGRKDRQLRLLTFASGLEKLAENII